MFHNLLCDIRDLYVKFEADFEKLSVLGALYKINKECIGSGNTKYTFAVQALSKEENKLKFHFLKNICAVNHYMCIGDNQVCFLKDDSYMKNKDAFANVVDHAEVYIFNKELPFVTDLLDIISSNPDIFKKFERTDKVGKNLVYYKNLDLISKLLMRINELRPYVLALETNKQ